MPKAMYLEAGEIVGTHGVRGELRVQPWCDTPEQLAAMRTFYWDEQGTKPVNGKARTHKNIALVQLDGVTTVEQAQALRGKLLYAHRDDFHLPVDRYFVRDLLGLSVTDRASGEVYGELCDVSQTGANSVYHVRTAAGEVLIPAVPDIVNEVDIDGGAVRITPIKGLFDDARIDVMTLFPEMCERVLGESILGRAQNKGAIEVHCHQIRDYTLNKQKQVDDYPYGGGQGMVMYAQPIADCFAAVCGQAGERPHLVYMSPQGAVLTQEKAKELSGYDNLCVLCGHYEGVDERVLDALVDEEISIGDYVLTGGELPALVLVDCVARMMPGVLSEEACFEDESHYNGLLEYPQYTRPAEWEGRAVPPVLLTGHHKNIAAWRREQSLLRTLKKRPELLETAELTDKERAWLAQRTAVPPDETDAQPDEIQD